LLWAKRKGASNNGPIVPFLYPETITIKDPELSFVVLEDQSMTHSHGTCKYQGSVKTRACSYCVPTHYINTCHVNLRMECNWEGVEIHNISER
jgi:hypothetical protein